MFPAVLSTLGARSLVASVLDEPRPAAARGPGLRDAVLIAVMAALTVLEGAVRADLPWRALSVVVVLAVAPSLAWRRSHPFSACLGTATANLLALLATGGQAPQLYSQVILVLLPYALARWGSGREVLIGTVLLVPGAVATSVLQRGAAEDVVGGVAVLLAALSAGVAVRSRVRARSRDREQVALLERERIARDLHDTVAHHVSAIAVRAQAGLALAPQRPEAAVAALELIEGEARATLAEMRAIVRALRTDDLRADDLRADDPRTDGVPLEPGPRLGDLARLATGVDDAPRVVVAVAGAPDAVPETVQSAVYRIAQESVTNARRHARGARTVRIHVAVGPREVHLEVTDDGAPGVATGHDGFGLRGMAERARLLGGTFEAGPSPDGGWRVRSVLPTGGVT